MKKRKVTKNEPEVNHSERDSGSPGYASGAVEERDQHAAPVMVQRGMAAGKDGT